MDQIAPKGSQDYLNYWAEYARKPIDWSNMYPKDMFDLRERVRRETLRGKLTFFHQNIEEYIFRQHKAYTPVRIFAHFAVAALMAEYTMRTFVFYFPEMGRYGMFWNHPNYKKLGHGWSWFYLLRIPMMFYVVYRLGNMFIKHSYAYFKGYPDKLSTFQYEMQYDDLMKDQEDSRIINFRYSDQKLLAGDDKYRTYNTMRYKAEADKAKQAFRFYKHGNDNFIDRLFK